MNANSIYPTADTLCDGRGWIKNPTNESGWFACRGCSSCGLPRVKVTEPPTLHKVKIGITHDNGETRPIGVPPSAAPPSAAPVHLAAVPAEPTSEPTTPPKRRGRKPKAATPTLVQPPTTADDAEQKELDEYLAPDALPGQVALPGCCYDAAEVTTPHTLDEVEAAGGYPVVLADPPWAYVQGGRGSTESHYKVMSLEEIRALPISRLAAPDAVLFLWGTWPQLPEVLETMRVWGFTYKTVGFVWVKHHEGSGKRHVGGGFWSRANTEFCLIGVRGKNHPKRVDATEARSVLQLIEEWPEEEVLNAPLGEHSAKPREVRERIRTMLGDVPSIELFARERVEGWDCWGDQVTGGSDVVL